MDLIPDDMRGTVISRCNILCFTSISLGIHWTRKYSQRYIQTITMCMFSYINMGWNTLQSQSIDDDWWILNCFFQAWSQIVYQLVPNVKVLEKTLENFADIIDADEILLFEKATFLVCLIFFINIWFHFIRIGHLSLYEKRTSRYTAIWKDQWHY